MQVIDMNIDDVKPYENNPRNNDEAVDATANSIKEFGWKQPIVVDKNNIIIVGHTRLKAAKKLGLKKVPVVVASDLSDDQVTAYRLADNKTGELAEWNTKLLDDEIQSLFDIDMSDFGFDEDIEFEPADSVSVRIDEPAEPSNQKEVTCPHCGETFKID